MELPQSVAYYERSSVRDEYLAFHYPDPASDPLRALLGERTPSLDERFPWAVRPLWSPRPNGRALDVGCAVGRMAIELARDHKDAIGLDLSPNLIAAARRVTEAGEVSYSTLLEGELRTLHRVAIDVPGNVSFQVGDALALPFDDRTFETVIALNLIDRVPDPRKAIAELTRVTAMGGDLIVASPYTWLKDYCPPEAWLGGTEQGGKRVRGFETLRTLVALAGFRLVRELRLPFYIPHHARTGQLGVAVTQVFRRTA